MEPSEILSRFDREMRRHPPPEAGMRVEAEGPVVRLVGTHSGIAYADLTEADAREVVAREAARFRALGWELEWKVYGHDRPSGLGELLRSAGFSPEPPETLMVADLVGPLAFGPPALGVSVRRVTGPEELARAVAVSREAFGTEEGWRDGEYAPRLSDPGFAAFLAEVDGLPVAVARLEMPPARTFASLWGGGTAPAYRGRGIYRRLVAVRAELARERGYRLLTVDARESSRPILERLGFRPLTSITGWFLQPEPV